MNRRKNSESLKSAFSLVEIITVISIITILAAITVPGMISLAPSRKTQASEVLNFLELARAKAMAVQQDVYVCFADDSFPDSELRFRGMTSFMASSLAEESEAIDTREIVQTEPWFQLTADVMFGVESDFAGRRQVNTRTVPESQTVRGFTFSSAGQNIVSDLPYLLFSKSGRVEVPVWHDSEIYIALVEGYVENGRRVIARKDEAQIGELIEINSNTGKCTLLRE